MAMSGIQLSTEHKQKIDLVNGASKSSRSQNIGAAFFELKQKGTTKTTTTWEIVEAEPHLDRNFSLDMVLSRLKEAEAMWCYADFDAETSDGPKSAATFIHWVADNCQIKKKMVLASTKDVFKPYCKAKLYWTACGEDELTERLLCSELTSKLKLEVESVRARGLD